MKTFSCILSLGLLLPRPLFAAFESLELTKTRSNAAWEATADHPPVVQGGVVQAGAAAKNITRRPDGTPWKDLHFGGYLKMRKHGVDDVVPWILGKTTNIRDEKVYNVSEGVRDDLYARASVLTVRGKTWGLVEVDAVGLTYTDTQKIREKLKSEGFTLINVAATHNHSGPDTIGFWGPIYADGLAKTVANLATGQPFLHLHDGKDKAFMDNLYEQSASALRQAKQTAQPATVYLGETPAPTVDGKSIFRDGREPSVFDDLIHIMQTRNSDGKAIATLAGVAMHPGVFGRNITRISADASGAIVRNLESRMGGVGIHVNGAIEAIAGAHLYGTDNHDTPKDLALREKSLEKIGEAVGQATLQKVIAGLPAPVDDMAIVTRKVFIPLDNQTFRKYAKTKIIDRTLYTNGVPSPDGQDLMTEMNLVILKGPKGEPLAEIFTIPGELAPEIYLGGMLKADRASNPQAPGLPVMKDYLRAPHQYLIGLGNDELGYIIPLNDFVYPGIMFGAPQSKKDRFGCNHYEETVSAGTQMAAIVTLNLIGMLQETYDGRTEWTPAAVARKARQDALQAFAGRNDGVIPLVNLYEHEPEDDLTAGARQALLELGRRGAVTNSVDIVKELRQAEARSKSHEKKNEIARLLQEIQESANPRSPERGGGFPSM